MHLAWAVVLLAAAGAPPHGAASDFEERHVDETGLDIKTISNGKEVALERHLARGKVTIFDFTAQWCKPCRVLGGKLAEFARRESRVAVRKIDVTDWNSPVVRQHLRGIKGLPYVEIFDRKGRRVTSLQIPRIWKIEDVVQPLLKVGRGTPSPKAPRPSGPAASSAAPRRSSPPWR